MSLKLAVLQIARAAGLFRLSRFLTRSKVRILCYHGGNIGDEHRFNSLLFCRGEVLDARLAWLRDTGFSVVPLDAAVKMLGSDAARPPLPTVLTFDDGWYSTYSGLHPVIARHRVPATLYLSTSYFVSDRPNLDVALGYILRQAGRNEIVVAGFDAALDGTHDVSTGAARLAFVARASAWLLRDGSTRDSVRAELERLAASQGVSAATLDLGSRRFDFANRDELLQMAAEGWTIELHGHDHLYPVGLPEVAKADVTRCATEIGKLGLPAAVHYCYPSGDHDDDAHLALEACGVVSATTCIPGLLERADGRESFYLSRFLDGEDMHPLVFESEMSGFADFLRRLAGRR